MVIFGLMIWSDGKKYSVTWLFFIRSSSFSRMTLSLPSVTYIGGSSQKFVLYLLQVKDVEAFQSSSYHYCIFAGQKVEFGNNFLSLQSPTVEQRDGCGHIGLQDNSFNTMCASHHRVATHPATLH